MTRPNLFIILGLETAGNRPHLVGSGVLHIIKLRLTLHALGHLIRLFQVAENEATSDGVQRDQNHETDLSEHVLGRFLCEIFRSFLSLVSLDFRLFLIAPTKRCLTVVNAWHHAVFTSVT